MARKIRTFLNDADGVSITDFISVVFVIAFVAASGMIVWKGLFLESNIQDAVVDTLRIMSNPLMVILGGYFGTKMVNKFVSRNDKVLNKKEDNRVKVTNNNEEDYRDYNDYGYDSEEEDDDEAVG